MVFSKGEKMKLSREEGQGLVEYALILVLVTLVVITVVSVLGPQVRHNYTLVNQALALIGQ
jgi:pilus assembly protein Flp/PilA